MRLHIEKSGTAMFTDDPVEWAVAVLDDGSEIRMRNFGDCVEVRTWDKTLTCNPPALEVVTVGHHVIDLRPERSPV